MKSAYAGFWIRAVALAIDTVVITILSFVGGFAVGFVSVIVFPSISDEALGILGTLVGLLSLFYFPFMESSVKQATLGKMALGVRVTDIYGKRIGFGKAILRWLAKVISGVLLLIGYLMVGFDEKKQGLHDKIAGTLVIRN